METKEEKITDLDLDETIENLTYEQCLKLFTVIFDELYHEPIIDPDYRDKALNEHEFLEETQNFQICDDPI